MASLYRPVYTKIIDGKRVRRKASRWYGKYRVNGREYRVALSEDKAVAKRLLAESIRQAELGSVGLDRYRDHLTRPLSNHLTDFASSLRDAGVSEDQVKLVSSRATRVLSRFATYPDITASGVQAAVANLRKKKRSKRSDATLSTQTVNFYLAATKQFTRWMVADKRAPENPIAHLAGGNVK